MSDNKVNKKEKILLEYLIANRDAFLKAYSILSPSYFESPLDKVVKYLKGYFDKYHSLPDTDVIEAETSIKLKPREVDASEIEWVLDEVEEHCQRAAMTEAILDSVDLVNEGEMEQVQSLVRNALTVAIDKAIGTDLFDDPRARIERTHANIDEIFCGIEGIDAIADGFRRKELVFFVAGTAVGKSITLANLARRFAMQKLDTLIISVEMNEDMYSKRLDSMVTGVEISKTPDIDAIVDGLDAVKDDYGRITTKRVNNKYGLESLRATLMEYHLIHGKYPDVLLLDYIDIFANGAMPRNVGGKFEWDEVKTHSVRDIMDEFNMYGFTASQTNRDAYGGVTDLGPEHIGGGLSKSQGADTVIFLIATEEDEENNCLTVKPGKLRNQNKAGRVRTIYRCPKSLRLGDDPFINAAKSSPVANKIKEKSQKSTKKQDDKKKDAEDLTNAKGKNKLKTTLSLMEKL